MEIKDFLLIWVVFFLGSCSSVKSTAKQKDIPVITENKLLKNIAHNSLEYQTIYAKKVNVSFIDKNELLSFKALMKIKKDHFIQVSVIAPLGIEVARVLLTPDSIKFMNMFDKKYFLSDYTYISDRFDVNLNFDCVQKILTNTFFDIESCGSEGKEKKYKLDRTDDSYLLSSIEEKVLSRKIKRLYKKKQKNKEYTLVLQKIDIDPFLFRPVQMLVEDMDDKTGVSVSYKNFKDYSGKKFPEKIVFNLFSEEKKTVLEIEFDKIEFNVDMDSNFRIPSKYTKMN